MPAIIEPQGPPVDGKELPLIQRLLWFAGLAVGGVGATAAVALGLHVLLRLH